MQCPGPPKYNFFSFKKIQQKFVNRSPDFHVFKLIADTDISVLRNYQSSIVCIFKEGVQLRHSTQITFHNCIQHRANS